MKTESEIIIALEELKSAYQLRLKNIETAITCISTASMIVDALNTCQVEQLKQKLQDNKMDSSCQDTPVHEHEFHRQAKIHASRMDPDQDVQAWIDSQSEKFLTVELAITESQKTVEPSPAAVVKKIDVPAKIMVNCPECGKEYVKQLRTKYCSKKCTKKVANRNYNSKKAKYPIPDPHPVPVNDIIENLQTVMTKTNDTLKDHAALNEKLMKIRKEIPVKRERPEIEHYF